MHLPIKNLEKYYNGVLILDFSYLVYKNYYSIAYRPKTPSNSKQPSELNSNIYGYDDFFPTYLVIKDILNVMRRLPQCLVIGFIDTKTSSDEKKQILDAYKGNRQQKIPSEVWDCFNKVIHDVLKALNISLLYDSDYEADDIILSFLSNIKVDNLKVYIYSSDKDLWQTAYRNPQNFMMIGKEYKILNIEQQSIEKYGISSRYLVDYLSIVGDQSDGIKGCVGYGHIFASSNLLKYKSAANIYKNIDKIFPVKDKSEGKRSKKASKFLSTINDFKQSKYLIWPKKYCIDKIMSNLKYNIIDKEKLRYLLVGLNWTSLLQYIDQI